MRRLFSVFRQPERERRRKEEPQKEQITKEAVPTPCPYCGELLPRKPERKRKCPFCKEVIFVRTDPETHEKIITTEEGAREIAARRERIAYRNRWLRTLGITEEYFNSVKKKLAEEFKREPSNRDVFWRVLNQQGLYYEMALFVEEEGGDFFPLLQQTRKMELLEYKKGGTKKVEILATGCPSCQKLSGKILDVDAALKEMPIPNKDCTTYWHNPNQGFCRCIYIAVLEWD